MFNLLLGLRGLRHLDGYSSSPAPERQSPTEVLDRDRCRQDIFRINHPLGKRPHPVGQVDGNGRHCRQGVVRSTGIVLELGEEFRSISSSGLARTLFECATITVPQPEFNVAINRRLRIFDNLLGRSRLVLHY